VNRTVDREGTVWFMRSPRSLWRAVGPEVLGATPEGEEIAHFSPTAAAVWGLLEEPRSMADVVSRLAAEYGEDPERIAPQVGRLLRDLVARGLVEAVADADD
jgi:hypothetical protein